jgi:hypothetical protein
VDIRQSKQKTASRVSVKARTLAHEPYCGVLGWLHLGPEVLKVRIITREVAEHHAEPNWTTKQEGTGSRVT